jgi:hypothetical protein
MRKSIALLAFSMIWVASALAKIADPPPVVDGNVVYQSHGNYVEALDSKSNNRLWKTIVYEAGYVKKFDPTLETDVQMNIIQTIRLQGDLIYIRNGKGQEFLLDKNTGKLR